MDGSALPRKHVPSAQFEAFSCKRWPLNNIIGQSAFCTAAVHTPTRHWPQSGAQAIVGHMVVVPDNVLSLP